MHTSHQEGAGIPRPKLPLVVTAKIPTKLRQKFLDSFIDEHLKRGSPAESAYQEVVTTLMKYDSGQLC